MAFESNGYVFKPHEMPIMEGSPASPDHPMQRRIAYLLIGMLLSITSGLQNGMLMASLPQVRGTLSLQLEEAGWIQVSYFMTYACMSMLFFKVRQHFGLQHFVRVVLCLLLIANIIQVSFSGFMTEIIARGLSGIASSGLLVMSMFYLLQAFIGPKKLIGMILAIGIMQLGTPLAQIMTPTLFNDGNLTAIFLFQFALVLCCIGLVMWLPIPPGLHKKALSKLDLLSFGLFAMGIALLCAFLVQGRIVWWTTSWLGWLLAGGIGFTGFALGIEYYRKTPMLDLHWISAPQILVFGIMGALIRIFTAEQTVGAAGLMTTLGMSNDQMVTFYVVVLLSSALGIVVSILRLDINDIRRPISVALLGIAIGSFMDVGVSSQTRPIQLYISQGIIAFSTLYFMGPMMLEGFIRALAKSPNNIMSFSAVFGLSQTLGGLAGAAGFSAFLTYRTREYTADMSEYFRLTVPNFISFFKQLGKIFSPMSSDPNIVQTNTISVLAQQTMTEATVLAYNDLFYLIGICATLAFLYNFITWAYRRYHKINIIGKELMIFITLMKK